jgi:glucoamylase
MPLAWAHAEFIKLAHSWALGRPFDRPTAVWERYQGCRPDLDYALWAPKAPITVMAAGQRLRVCVPMPARVKWRCGNTAHECDTTAAGLGFHIADLDTRPLPPGGRLSFSFRYRDAVEPQGDFVVTVKA